MADRSVPGAAAAVVLALALLAGAIQVQAARERAYPIADTFGDSVYITSASAVRGLAGAFSGLAADVYWVRAIQYYGGTKRRLASQPAGLEPPAMLAAVESQEYGQLYTLLDIATTLDPQFVIAYRFGAVFLAEAYPAGAGRTDLAVRLLEKGLRDRPDKWEYMHDIGFVYYWYAHDYGEASARFQQASEMPGAPEWLKGLAAMTLARGGDRQSSRTMWRAILESSEVDWMRATAERVLAQLDALDRMEAVQTRLDAFSRSRGTIVSDWGTAIRAGLFPGVPLDPARTPFELTSEGQVQLSRSSPLFPLPVEPAQTRTSR